MKKIVAIVCVFILALVLFISGCTEQNTGSTSSDLSKFVGTWDGGHWETSIEDKDETWTFYDNGSLKMVDNVFDGEITWGTYEIDGSGELCIRKTEIQSLMCYTYAFTDDDNQFTLTLGDTTSYRFAKSE